MKAKHTMILVLTFIVGSHVWRSHKQTITNTANDLAATSKTIAAKNISLVLVAK